MAGRPDGMPEPGPAAPGVELEKISGARPVPPGMVLGYVDLAITGALQYERYRNVYLSPWWEVPDTPLGTHVWKRSVLDRRIGAGAAHWGHLYLVVEIALEHGITIFGRDWRGRRTKELAKPRILLREGEQTAELMVRPIDPHRVDLEDFANEVKERFRRQMD